MPGGTGQRAGGGGDGGGRGLHYTAPAVPSFLQSLHSQVHGGGSRRGDDGRRHAPSRRLNQDDADDLADSDELDGLLGVSSSRARFQDLDPSDKNHARKGDEAGSGGEEDEWDGAQVVVLKEGRHLSEQEVQAAKATSRASSSVKAQPAPSTSHIATAGAAVASSSKRKRAVIGDQGGPSQVESSSSSLLLPASSAGEITGKDKKKQRPGADAGSYEGLKELLAQQRASKASDSAPRPSSDAAEEKAKAKAKEKKAKAERTRKEKKKTGKGLSFDVED